jgi:hypothetical protein
MAKDILGRHCRIYLDNSVGAPKDLSDDMLPNTLSGIGLTPEEVDMTGQSASIKQARTGVSDSTVTAQFFMNDTATTGAFTVLEGIQGLAGTLTVMFGTDGAPANGDWEWEGEYVLFGLPVSISGGAAVMNATFKPAPGSTPAWGVVSGL